jgi:hypothetical protein
MPGTSFQRTTFLAPRAQHASGVAGRERQVGRRSAVLTIGVDDGHGVDERRSDTASGKHGREDGGREPLATRHEGIRRACLEVSEHANRHAQVAVLPHRGIDGRQQCTPGLARRQQLPRDPPVTVEERRCHAGRLSVIAPFGVACAFEQAVGHTSERRTHDDERSRVRGNQTGGLADPGGIGQRGAAELPGLQVRARGSGTAGRHGRVPSRAATVARSMARRTAS